jgi:hypothetical protein
MAVQTQLMQRMAEAMEHRGNGGNRVTPQDEELTRKIERFIRLMAPTFSYSDDPLEADDWLRVTETKLDLTVCSDEECVTITAHQLEGPTKAWWENYTATHPNPAFITWLEFCEAFREQYLPGELLVQKAQEFRTMTQGVMRVEEYERHFMKMMRYAPDDTNTDQKKQFWFLRGLHHGLRQTLKASEHKSLCHLVNRAIAVEDERRGHEERMRGKKRMGDRDQPDRSFQKPRSGQSNMLRGSYRPGHNQPGRGFGGGGRSLFPGGRNPGYPQQTGGYTRAPPSTARPAAGGFAVTCFACGKPGHKSYDCPEKKTAATPARAPALGGRPSQAAPSPAAGRGRLNHLTEEEAADAPDIVIGKFLVCGTTALVLFDTSATESYVTSRFVNKLSLPITTRSIPIIMSSPLGDIRCTLLCKGVDIDIQGHKFFGDLTVLPSHQGRRGGD